MNNQLEREKAIELYKKISSGKINGLNMVYKRIKVGSITFLIEKKTQNSNK